MEEAGNERRHFSFGIFFSASFIKNLTTSEGEGLHILTWDSAQNAVNFSGYYNINAYFINIVYLNILCCRLV